MCVTFTFKYFNTLFCVWLLGAFYNTDDMTEFVM